MGIYIVNYMQLTQLAAARIFNDNYHRAIATIDEILTNLKHSTDDSRRTTSVKIRVD